MWSAPAVTTSRFCSILPRSTRRPRRRTRPADQAVLLVHPGDPLAVRAARERRVVRHPPGHRLVGLPAAPSPASTRSTAAGTSSTSSSPASSACSPSRSRRPGSRAARRRRGRRRTSRGATQLTYSEPLVSTGVVRGRGCARASRSSIAAVHGDQRPADAPAEQRDLVLRRSRAASRGSPTGARRTRRSRAPVGVLVARHAPVEQEDVEALLEQELDERVARAQVEDVGPVDQREHEQHRAADWRRCVER